MFDLLASVYLEKIDANIACTFDNVKCGDLTPLSFFIGKMQRKRGLMGGFADFIGAIFEKGIPCLPIDPQ